MATYEVVVNHLAAPQSLVIKSAQRPDAGAGRSWSGILLERVGQTAVIGGIGVNLAAAPGRWPTARSPGTSPKTAPAPDRDTFARDLAASFDRELDRWRQVRARSAVRAAARRQLSDRRDADGARPGRQPA